MVADQSTKIREREASMVEEAIIQALREVITIMGMEWVEVVHTLLRTSGGIFRMLRVLRNMRTRKIKIVSIGRRWKTPIDRQTS